LPQRHGNSSIGPCRGHKNIGSGHVNIRGLFGGVQRKLKLDSRPTTHEIQPYTTSIVVNFGLVLWDSFEGGHSDLEGP
jgi:hypothetical protein